LFKKKRYYTVIELPETNECIACATVAPSQARYLVKSFGENYALVNCKHCGVVTHASIKRFTHRQLRQLKPMHVWQYNSISNGEGFLYYEGDDFTPTHKPATTTECETCKAYNELHDYKEGKRNTGYAHGGEHIEFVFDGKSTVAKHTKCPDCEYGYHLHINKIENIEIAEVI